MTNTEELRKLIKESGVTITFLAKKAGITRECFYQRLRSEAEFKASEIAALTTALHMTRNQRDAIFLLKCVIFNHFLTSELQT